MKAQVIEKNGFPKPLGLMLIVIILSIACYVLFLSGQSLTDDIYVSGNLKTAPKVYLWQKSELPDNNKSESGDTQHGSVFMIWSLSDQEENGESEESGFNESREESINLGLDFIVEEIEQEIPIEEWMYEESYWSSAKKAEVVKNELFEEEEDEEIKIEPWMYEEKYWPSGKKKEKKK